MPVPRRRGAGSKRIPPRWLNADHPRVRLTPDLDDPWLLEFDRRRHEIYMNSAAFGLTDVEDPKVRETIGEVGAQVLIYLSDHPSASDEEISQVGLRAAGLDGPVFDA